MAEESKKTDVIVDSEGTVVAEHSSMKKKKKSRENKDNFSEPENEKLSDDSVVKKKSKKKSVDSEDSVKESEKTSEEIMVDSASKDSVKVKQSTKKRSDSVSETEDCVKESKKKSDEVMVDSESKDVVKKTKKKNKEKMADSVSESEISAEKSKEISVDSVADDVGDERNEKPLDDGKKKKTVKRKLDDTDLGADENTEKESKKKKKKVVNSEVGGNNKDSTKDAINENQVEKQNIDSQVQENDLNSVKDGEKKKQKKKKKLDGTDLGADENTDIFNKEINKKVKQNVDSEVEQNAKKKTSKKKVSENALAEENNNDGTKDAEKKKRKKKKKEKCSKSGDEDVVTTPSSKSNKKVKFSDQVEVFPSEDKDSEDEEHDDDEEEVELVRGKRFTKEEDALVKQAVLDYIDNHALGDNGLDMVMNCKKHPEIKGCWKEIESALPWRARSSVYYRAHNLFEEGSKGVWTKEDLELVKAFQAKHGNDWKTIAGAMGKHRVHVKDAWRRIRLDMNKGHWSREEYQTLFDLVNTDIKMKAFKEKHSKHGMLRDNIPWMAISDQLGTRGHVHCCEKWYNQLTSPMVAKGIWANVDDYRLLEELTKLDAACIDDVEWDELLENRDGYACRKRWNQMVLHIGSQGSKTFAEQVEILSQRYCPDLAEEVEDYEKRPFDPEN